MDVQRARALINYQSKLVMAGSCFSEHIYKRLSDLNFKIEALPNGIVFNPLSVLEPFKRICEGREFIEDDLVFHNHMWHGLYHHGHFSGTIVSDVLLKMNHHLSNLKFALAQATHVYLTFGSSYVYELKSSPIVVANCHKMPSDLFSKRLLKLDDMVDEVAEVCGVLRQKYPNIQIVLTVSPVKHLRDGVSNNVLSKSQLIQMCHQLMDTYDYIDYFPAYELVNEDLRDYRFFESDGAHPNALAIDYVFNKFVEASCDEISKAYIKDMSEFNRLKSHKIIHADGEDYIKFMNHLEERRVVLSEKYNTEL
jgi:hypothetical protein